MRFERRYAHPPAKVWRALTEPEHLSAWYPFPIEELDLRVGGIIRYREPDGDPTDLYAEITELEPHRRLAFTEFDRETGRHRLRLTLEPDGAGCVLTFEHTFADNPWAEQTFTGWQGCLDVLGTTVACLDLGVLDDVDGAPVLRFERRLAHSPQRVWRALTDPAELARWFPVGVDAVPETGAPMRFVTGMSGDFAEGRVLECDPPTVYSFRWARSVLRFELAAGDDGGCLLRFSHTLSGTDTSGHLPSVARQGPGWEQCLDALAALLDGIEPPQRDGQWFLARAETYVEEYGLADGTATFDGDGVEVRFERDLVQAPDVVWSALTEGDPPITGEATPVRFTHGHVGPGPVTRVDPGRYVEYAAAGGAVRFELRDQEPIGTRLLVTQTLPGSADVARALAAWHTHLELLFAALHGDVRCPWPEERTEQLRRRYAERDGQQATAGE
nr:SRPBCC domain-containing protein [Prauserella isguenensis]